MSVVKLGSNIASLTAQRRLGESTQTLSRIYERLSSGQRINRASDDAAGLSISQSLKADAKVFTQGIRNLNDGISLLNIADSAIENLSSILIRLEELAEQSANGTYGNQQRKALDAEAQALSKEFFRIAKTTKFNGIDLFGGSLGQINLQAGVGENAVLSAGVGGAIGTGQFGEANYYTMTSVDFSRSTALSLGDLNGDGILDLVTGGDSFSGQEATIRLGIGDGTFGISTSYAAAGMDVSSVTLGDLNGDGILDLVTAGFGGGSGRTTIRLGAGDGTFGAALSYAMESGSSNAVSLADLNGDGILDLVTAGFGAGGRATIRLGAGDGTFGAALSYGMESGYSSALTLGDLNGDGILDLVTAGYGGYSGQATIRLGRGDGSFGGAVSYAMDASRSNAISLGDLNGDSILDLVTAGFGGGSGQTTIRLGAGNGTFGPALSYETESGYSSALTLGDVNGDGILDLVTAGYELYSGGGSTIRLGAGDGTFGEALDLATENAVTSAVSLGDLNGDGVLDLVTAGYHWPDGMDGIGAATIRLGSTTSGVAPLLTFSLKTLADARQAIPALRRKREQLSLQRGEIGAFQSRVTSAVGTLTSARENYLAAESRITDADVAAESAALVRTQILQQAAASVLAQANQQPQIALRLFEN